MNDKQFENLIEKVDVVAKLLALNVVSDKKTLVDKVVALSEAGFRPKDIGWLLGKDAQRINDILYKQKKRGTKFGDKMEATKDG